MPSANNSLSSGEHMTVKSISPSPRYVLSGTEPYGKAYKTKLKILVVFNKNYLYEN